MKLEFLKVAASAAGLAFASTANAGEMSDTQIQTMHNFADQSVVAAAEAKLMRLDDGVYTVAHTNGLKKGHAVTMWWVVFNDPSKCSGGECGEDDVFNLDGNGEFILNADGSAPMNLEMHKMAGISVLRADGRVIGSDGNAVYKSFLPVGDVSDAAFGPGLKDPQKAEIHLVLRDHMIPEAEKLSEALNTIHGACDAEWPNAPCEDVQFAVFAPAAVTN